MSATLTASVQLLPLVIVVLTYGPLVCSATFNLFISNSQLEIYFRESPELSLVEEHQVDIIKDGVSLVSEDGSLSLVECEACVEAPTSSGSGEIPGSESPSGSPMKKKRETSFLSPMATLPALPADVDAVVFTWHAASSAIPYQLSFSDTPVGHFQEISTNISTTGFIPTEISDFSVAFPCGPYSMGIGSLQVILATTTLDLTVNFTLQKICQGATLSPSPSFPPSTSFFLVPSTTVLSATPIPSTTPTLASSTPESTTSEIFPTPTESLLPSINLPATTEPSFGSPVPSLPPSLLSSSVAMQTVAGTPLSTTPPPLRPEGTRPTPATTDSFLQLLIIVFAPVVATLIISIFILCCSICICCVCCRRKTKRHFNDDPADLPVNMTLQDNLFQGAFEMEDKKDEVPISLWMSLPWGSVSNLPAGIQGVIKRYSADRRLLSIISTVSRGEYGCIVNGQLSANSSDPLGGNKGVMMKMYIGFQKQYGHRDEITKFLEMATLLRGLDHPNVLSMLLVSVEDDYVPLVVYPIMEYGNLHQFLVLCRLTPSDTPLSPFTLQYKVSFAHQIASGMKHLSDAGIVHPDLALRNCYLDTHYQVKVSDGALSQCFYPDCYHAVRGTVRPVRWAAIETLQEGLCTSQSNVWSYGVTVWELMTLAKLPYCDEVGHNRGVFTHLMMQNRLAKPEGCPDNIYSIMSDCWRGHPEDRPNFDTIFSVMHEINSKYATALTPAPPIAHKTNEIKYSTFGKDLRAHDAPPLETASVTLSHTGSFNRRVKPVMANLRGPPSRGSPANSQRNSFLGADNISDNRLSLTFSVLSNENEFDPPSDSEVEEPKGLNFEIPSFLTVEQNDPAGAHPSHDYMGGFQSPMNLVSTFLGGAARPPHEQTDSAPPDPPLSADSQATPVPPSVTPTSSTTQRPLYNSSSNNPLSAFPGSVSPDVVPPAVSITPSNQDTISKPSTPDSFATYSSGHNSTPSSHIPGIPGSTYNNTSVSIDDIPLRNKSLLRAGNHAAKSASMISSGASKSDSGIRSDEEVESVLSTGGQSSAPVVAGARHTQQNGHGATDPQNSLGVPNPQNSLGVSDPRNSQGAPNPRTSLGAPDPRNSLGITDPRNSLGMADLSNDLMAKFASWGKN